jgi:hypothetical protein
MNDVPNDNPHLRLLEARLAATALQLPQEEQRQLLYQCAFTAGQVTARRASARSLYAWIGATTLLAVCTLTLGYRAVRLPVATALHSEQGRWAKEHRPGGATGQREGIYEDSRLLSVMTPLERAVDFDWPPVAASDGGGAISEDVGTDRTLTPMSKVSTDVPWN